MPSDKLHLKKIECIVMLLRNLAPSQGLCNGIRLIVTKLQRIINEAKVIIRTSVRHFYFPAAYDSIGQQRAI